MKALLHALFGTLALATVALFWSATLVAELFLDAAAIAWVKAHIVQGLFILVPALALTGASGFALARSRRGALVARKKKRMPFLAANGLLVLLPAALVLDHKAGAGQLDGLFYAVQALELAAGLLQLWLLGLNFRDGLRLSGRRPLTQGAG